MAQTLQRGGLNTPLKAAENGNTSMNACPFVGFDYNYVVNIVMAPNVWCSSSLISKMYRDKNGKSLK